MTRYFSLGIWCYSVQPKDRIFVKGYRFLSSARNMDKNVGKNISKHLISKYCQKTLDQKRTGEIKLLTKLREPQILHQRIIQKQMKKKYLEKDLYLQN